MSTAVVALVAGSATKVFSVNAQTEPDFLGYDLLALLRPVIMGTGTEASVKAQTVALQAMPTRQITQAEFDNWKAGHPTFTTVTTIDQFYAALASIQGDVAAMLNFGVYQDYVTFNADPGFQQVDWGYVIDFDTRVFEIYRGFQLKQPTRGRLVGVPINTGLGFKAYYPLQMVGTYTFAQVVALGLPARWWATS